ncbi:phage tail sheath family protein [Ureibacillus chungkukjangi]|uniref:phage tail sheath family protein n=1 Tax=Ureibacillus chungkukjangi TaxID=1202712 RepID=UPI00384A5DC2
MSYQHGIGLNEKPTSISSPEVAYSAIQVVTGTAPINLVEDPAAVVNKPLLIHSFDEGKEKLGYSDDWDAFTLCEVMDASFREFKVGPVVFINVLDPTIHKKSSAPQTIQISNKEGLVDKEGVLLSTLVVNSSDGATTYVKDQDYFVSFNQNGKPLISVLTSGQMTSVSEIQVTFDELDPTKVTNADIIGGYDVTENKYKGLELIQTVYPTLGVLPNTLLAPGFSHHAEVGNVLVAKSTKINGAFNAINVLDVSGKTKEAAGQNKDANGYNDKSSIVCWPKAKIGKKTYHYSSIVASAIAKKDSENEGVPYKSPSNSNIPVTAMVNDENDEVFLDQVEGNVLNGTAIVTAINMGGWKLWGNNTAAYDPELGDNNDPKDRFIALRRMFDWWGNSFIQTYFEKVDNPTNTRLIESVVDSENIRANGFKAKGQIAGAKIEFNQQDNPISNVLNGKIQFSQKMAFFTPAEFIENNLEFDPNMLSSAIFGGE